MEKNILKLLAEDSTSKTVKYKNDAQFSSKQYPLKSKQVKNKKTKIDRPKYVSD